MVKKWKWFKIEHSTDGKNTFRLASESNLEYKIKFFDKLGNEVKKWDDLEHTGARNSAEIILEYESNRGSHNESDPSEVECRLVDGASKNTETLEKAEQEACVEIFGRKWKDKFDNNYNEENFTDILCRLVKKGENGISFDLQKKNDPASNLSIRSEDVKMIFYSYLTKRISLRDQIEVSEMGENKPYWTPKKIIFCAFLVVIFLLIIIFWKKIWGWIRGKSKQEKKIEEQIDIF